MTCQNCKHATYYPSSWWYPYLDPLCDLGYGTCKLDKTCDDFELIGRLSR